jgi:dTDP-4-amino-4,6-dideoxygalactose transaminase
MDALLRLADRHGLTLIEDCAHAIETTHRQRPAGTMGRFGCFSFYATKNLTTGEGGMLLCRDPFDAERARRLALHGLSHGAHDRFAAKGFPHYTVVEPGFKYNMMDVQAALGLRQLEKVEAFALRRAVIAKRYERGLADLPIQLPTAAAPDTRHAHHLYPLLIDEARAGLSRDEFLLGMKQRRIGVGVHYLALPEHPYYQQQLGWRPEATPHATAIGRRTASVPLTPYLTDRDVHDVLTAVHDTILP